MAKGKKDQGTLSKEELLQCLKNVRAWLEAVEYSVANCACDEFPRMPQTRIMPHMMIPCPKDDSGTC